MPSGGPDKKRKKNKPANQHDTTAKNKENAPEVTSSPTNIIEEKKSPPVQPSSANNHWDAGERFFYRWYLRSQWILVCITLGGIVIAVYTLRSLNESVGAANRQASAAATQNVIIQEEFISTQRSRVVVGNQDGVLASFVSTNGKQQLALNFKNVGHSPANEVVTKQLPETYPPPFNLSYSSLRPTPAGTIATGPTISLEKGFTDYIDMSSKTVESVKTGKLGLRIVGFIQYWDDFGDYCEPFAIRYVGNGIPHFEPQYAPQFVCTFMGGESIQQDASGNGKITFQIPSGAQFSHYRPQPK